MDKVILSIDCGTQSLRVLMYSPEGDLLAKEQVQYEPYVSPMPGWAEQDPEIFWNSVCTASLALKEKHPEWFAKVAGVGVTTQRDSMVNVDREGNPLRPVITWLDQRKAKPVYHPSLVTRTVFKTIGMDEPILKSQTDAKCNWIRQNQPDIWLKTHKYLQVSGFLNFRLTGQYIDSIGSQIGHIPFSYKKQKWSSKTDMSRKLFPVERKKLPDLVPPGELIGYISDNAATSTGIAKGIPVIACASDKGCETLGMGVLNEDMASLSFGTTATVQTTTKDYREPQKFMPSYPAPIPGFYNPEIEIFRGFWMITWFKNEFAFQEIQEAEAQGVPAEVVLNNLLKQSPPGAMGLIVQPYWSPGLKTPSAKGAMIGFGDVHKKAHVYRAVIEGLCYALLDGLQHIESSTGKKMKKLAVSGGASQSAEICQIAADVFNLPLVRGRTHETSGLGAAIVTAVGLKIYPSFKEAINKMVQYDQTFYPIQENVKIYDQMFNRVYQKIYPVLLPLYEEIRDITGYPSILQ
ncbi:MAG: FGGY-family carbohydrate kinase [SAR324 cluster bacterium]|nr:FGGY-family carbohydrate kinase [SAR324 cluster bacterium]